MSTDHRSLLDHSVPQWKRELILRRRAVGRVLPAGSGSVQLTCPSVVAAVRYPEYSPASDLHLKTCASEREQAVSRKNMRLVEQINASGDFSEPGLLPDVKRLSKIENYSVNYLNMGEEKNYNNKKNSSGHSEIEKKSSEFLVNEDDSLSDSSEELKYGPGIVSRLKSRYLSLTLRESQGRIRPTLPYMRRATSLENILDGPEVEKCEESKPKYIKNVNTAVNGSVSDRCRSLTRGNKDSMKRAGSVETLIRYDRVKGVGHYNRRSYEIYSSVGGDENDQRKLIRNTICSAVEDKELPPPDVVKHTLKIFENSSSLAKNCSLGKISAVSKGSNENNSVCAQKPTIFPKPAVCGKVKCGNVHLKSSPESFISRSSSEPPSKVAGKSRSGSGDEDPSEHRKNTNNKASLEKPTFTERQRRPVVFKEIYNESVGTKNTSSSSSTEANGELSTDSTDSDGKVRKGSAPSPGRDGIGLDSPEAQDISSFLNNNGGSVNSSGSQNNNKQKTPSTRNTSPDANSEDCRGSSMSPESMRSISPVLVRAPPCILSSEVNANTSHSPSQHHMKQLGVVRPIVTNKAAHVQGHKYSANKSHSVLTEREIEKNLINSVKSIEQPVTKVIVSLKKSPEECIIPSANNESKQNEESKKGLVWDSRKPNTMVFNFSNRKTVPDYIENDGLILASRKDKPKRGEPGIIFLGGGTYDSSTDFDCDDQGSDPPSPCDFTFEGDNILINGKSNIQSKPKLRKMKIQFNDEATTMFEYPSEASLLDDQEVITFDTEAERVVSPVNGSSAAALPNPFRCSSLASYTPSKLSLSRDFQLGVTKTTPPSPAPRAEKPQPPEVEDEYLRPADEGSTVTWSSETAADLLF